VANSTDNNPTAGILSGYIAYPRVDPWIIGGVTGSSSSGNLSAGDVTLMNSFNAGTTQSRIPAVNPNGLTISHGGPDPVLSIPVDLKAVAGGTVTVPVNIDTADPAGSTGMTDAVLALHFDPRYFMVLASDIQLGTVPASGCGWKLTMSINSTTGDIGIDVYSTTGTPIQSTSGGSLVTIALHVRDTAPRGSTGLSFLTQSNPTGSRVYTTIVGDVRGAYVIHTADGGQWNKASSIITAVGAGIPTVAETPLIIVEPGLEQRAKTENQGPQTTSYSPPTDSLLGYLAAR